MNSWLPEDLTVGRSTQLSPDLATRLVRFHLVDNVRGQTLPFAGQEVLQADITIKVIGQAQDQVQLSIQGASRAESKGPWTMDKNLWWVSGEHPRGFRTKIYGEALFDLKSQSFTSFEMIAKGIRWGSSPINGRGQSKGPSPIATLFRIAGEKSADRLAPTFIDIYDVDWLVPPQG